MRQFLLAFFVTAICACADHDLSEVASSHCGNSDLSFSINQITSATDCNSANASVSLITTGGKEPYTYIVNGEVKPLQYFTTLLPGIYIIKVRDGKGCEIGIENIVVPALNVAFHLSIESDTDCLAGNGSVTIHMENAESTYSFQFAGQPASGNNTFKPLASGTYHVIVRDENNCTIPLNISIPKGVSGTSWVNDVKPIIETSCAISGCHDGKSRPDLRIYDKAKFYAAQIKSMTKDKSMPFDGALTEQEINLIACWVDDGALNN